MRCERRPNITTENLLDGNKRRWRHLQNQRVGMLFRSERSENKTGFLSLLFSTQYVINIQHTNRIHVLPVD